MAARRQKTLILLGAALLAGVAALVPDGSEAQNLRPVLRDDDGPLPRLRPRTAPPIRPSEPPADADPAPQPRLRPTQSDAPLSADAPAADQDQDAELAPSGVRPAVRDGDPGPPLEPEPVIDGASEEPEVYRNPDGQDPVQWDARDPADSDAFERPPAGHDPQAFGVELSPLDDRRTLQLYRFEPWQPRGIRLGSFTVYPQADIGAAYVSNLFRSRTARADQALELRPTIRAVSSWHTHALELRATAGLSFFDAFPREDDRAYALEARGRLDVTRRTQLSAGVLRDVAQESRGTLESRLRGGQRADVTTDEGRLQLDHRLNRLAVQVRGQVQSRGYEDTWTDGVRLSNRDRNLRATEEALRLSWTFKPTFIAFAESALNQRRFEAASLGDGVRRDSDGERYRVGIGFGTSGNVLRGEASIGYGRQAPLDFRLGLIDGVILDANLAWRASALTAVLLRVSTDVIETATVLSSGGLTRRGQIEVRHAFMRPLIGTASAGISSTNYQGIVINETLTELALGLEYHLAPEAVLYGRYQHADLRTSAPGASDWSNDEVRVGVRLRR